jgi:hypothetical protein
MGDPAAHSHGDQSSGFKAGRGGGKTGLDSMVSSLGSANPLRMRVDTKRLNPIVYGITSFAIMHVAAGVFAPATQRLVDKTFLYSAMTGIAVWGLVKAFDRGDEVSRTIDEVCKYTGVYTVDPETKQTYRPRLRHIDRTNKVYQYQVPPGLSREAYTKAQPAINLALDAETEIWEEHGYIRIRVLDTKIPTLIEFPLDLVKGGGIDASADSMLGHIESRSGIHGPSNVATHDGAGIYEVGEIKLPTHADDTASAETRRTTIRCRYEASRIRGLPDSRMGDVQTRRRRRDGGPPTHPNAGEEGLPSGTGSIVNSRLPRR